jgi:UTP-glucose-1-phosphate uridylyltransferase
LEYTFDDGKFIPRSKAKKRFNLSDIQLTLAINKCLVRCKQAFNPYNGKPFDLVSLNDLQKNLEEILKVREKSNKKWRELW